MCENTNNVPVGDTPNTKQVGKSSQYEVDQKQKQYYLEQVQLLCPTVSPESTEKIPSRNTTPKDQTHHQHAHLFRPLLGRRNAANTKSMPHLSHNRQYPTERTDANHRKMGELDGVPRRSITLSGFHYSDSAILLPPATRS